jgi:hypothetical protein
MRAARATKASIKAFLKVERYESSAGHGCVGHWQCSCQPLILSNGQQDFWMLDAMAAMVLAVEAQAFQQRGAIRGTGIETGTCRRNDIRFREGLAKTDVHLVNTSPRD